MAVVTVWLLRQVPATRKAEIQAELDRYDFDTRNIPERKCYEFRDEGLQLTLDANGMTVNGKFFWYGHLKPGLVTTNRFNRVWLAIQFGEDPKKAWFVPLSAELIHAVQTLPVPLTNPERLDFLLTHRENVIAQVYNTGTFRIFEE